jgi:tripartite-type tricarboxylate transporter receptor subunit TctC
LRPVAACGHYGGISKSNGATREGPSGPPSGPRRPARLAIVPELPPVAESGLPGFAANGWSGLFLPKGVAPEISKLLIEAIGKVLAEEPIQEQLRKAGGEPWVITGEEMRAFVQQEYGRYGELIRIADIKLE